VGHRLPLGVLVTAAHEVEFGIAQDRGLAVHGPAPCFR
jgi:hypothetical protein